MARYTDITILLDRSGSMETIKSAMESGFNEFVQGHRAIPTTRLTLVQFDNKQPYEEVYVERPITDVPELNLRPRGWTPLLDAACKAIDKAGQRLAAKREQDRPDKVLFVIVTDGHENYSTQYRREDVRKRIEHQSAVYKWEFTYLGANQDAYAEAVSLGIDFGKALNFAAVDGGTKRAWRGLTSNTVAYAATCGTASLGDYTKAQIDSAVDTSDDRITTTTTDGKTNRG